MLCVDLVPEQRTEVVNVLVVLTGAEPVALLDEGVRCPRCVSYLPEGACAPEGAKWPSPIVLPGFLPRNPSGSIGYYLLVYII